MVYANIVDSYEVHRKDGKNIYAFRSEMSFWRQDEDREYGIMQAADKARMDRQADLKDFLALREWDNSRFFDPIKDDYFEW